MRISLHRLTSRLIHIFDEAQVERASTILVSLELGDGSFRSLGRVKFHYSATPRAAAWLILDLGLVNLANSGKKLNEIVIARGPWKLRNVLTGMQSGRG